MGKKAREKRERRLQAQLGVVQQPAVFAGKSMWIERICLLVIQWGTYLVLFAPLLVVKSSFFPFVTPKTIFFNILVEIILAAYLILIIFQPRWRPRITPLTMGIGLFLAILVLASFTGINFERSFWSTFERMTGLFTLFHLFAFFIVLSAVFKKRVDWEKILGVAIFAGVILSLYVLSGQGTSSRGGGTIGNTSFMAAYLLFDIFFALALFLSSFLTRRYYIQIYSGIALLIMLPVLLFSTARGAIIAFGLGLFLIVLGYLFFSQKQLLRRCAWAIVLGIIVFSCVCLIVQPDFAKTRVDNLMSEMKPRFTVWNMAWQSWQERPLLGWGPENFNVGFNKHFNPCLFLGECGGEIWFDRAHNIIFDVGVSSGLVGLISYLTIFGVAISGLLRVCSRVAEKRELFVPLILAALLVVYFFQNLLVFDMINTYLMFFLCLAFINVLTKKEEEEEALRPARNIGSISRILTAAVIIFFLFIFWKGNIQPAQSAHFTVKMVSASRMEDANLFFQKSLNSWMEKYEPREYFATRVPQFAFDANQNKEAVAQAFELAETEMEKSIKKNSLDFRPHLFLGKIYNSSYYFYQDAKKLDRAEQVLIRAIELSPTNQQGYWYLAEIRLAQGRSKETIVLLQKAIDLEPRLNRSHWYLAMALRIDGQYQLSLEKIKQAEQLGYPWKKSMTDLKKVIDIYLALADDANLIPLYQIGLNLEPNNTKFWASLMASYANLGEFEKAREAAQKLLEIDPELAPKIEEFLKTLSKD
jgi:O-antigen ligase/tetratricopeptide (TPR) repeat protein